MAGPNGTGKTTTIRMMLDIMKPNRDGYETPKHALSY